MQGINIPRILVPGLFAAVCCIASGILHAQTALEATIQVTASTGISSPYITLSWPAISGASGNIRIWKREKGSSSWGTATSLPSSALSYADSVISSSGVIYEYSLQCPRSTAPYTAYGSIVAGCNIPIVENRGNLILLIDSTLASSLSQEITQLQNNLVADGWRIFRHDVTRQSYDSSSNTPGDNAKRLAEVSAIRAIVQNDYNNNGGGRNWALFIIGHVPVPYSGAINPDGHQAHLGAWPTDAYYSTVTGTWSDTTVSTGLSGLSDARNYNNVGDGKFDQGVLPADVVLQTGRVDFANMANVPSGMTEVELLRQYLVRNHQFRRNLAPYSTVARRALIDDGFNYFSGESFGSSGWRTGFSWFGRSASQTASLDWFNTLTNTPVLLAYGSGSGEFTSADGVGRSTVDFGKKDSKAVFNMLFGSWFGDWDSKDNFLKAPLAGTANSLGLASVWSGRGYFQLFHMALGEIIGYDARYTQNNQESTYSGGWVSYGVYNFNRYISIALMGDPTLRLHSVAPPAKVTATSTAGGITLNWFSSPDAGVSGYHIYRSTSNSGPFTRITGTVPDGTNPTGSCLGVGTFTYTDTDVSLVAGTSYTYLVKAVRMETSASGSYANQSLADPVTITHLMPSTAQIAPTRLIVVQTAGNACTLTWDDNAVSETSYIIERRDPTTGIWSQIASRAPNTTTYTDTASPIGKTVYYRVRAAGAVNSNPSNEAADFNRPGIVYGDAYSTTVSKIVGAFNPTLTRFNGNVGNVSVSYTTTPILATEGVDYTTTSGSVVWNHGESGSKPASIAIANLPGAQLSKLFKVTYSSPTNGLAVGSPSSSYVFILDPAALTLPTPWSTSTLGTSTDPGFTESAGGSIGLATRNKDLYVRSDNDNLRFAYQPISGDFQFTARLTYLSTTSSVVRAGIIARGSAVSGNPVMDSLFLNTLASAWRWSRTTSTNSYLYGPMSTYANLPQWLRMTRAGSTFHVEGSNDGLTWTASADSTPKIFSEMPATVYVGLGVATDPTADNIGALGYARFDNITLYTPVTDVSALTASSTTVTHSGQITLTWTASSAATSYTIERSTSPESGFIQIASSSALTYTDTSLTPNTIYYYRVKAANPAYQATSYSPQASSAPYVPTTTSGWLYTHFGSESPTGVAALSADPDADGITNLMEYALGLDPLASNATSSLPCSQTETVGIDKYLTYTFTRNKFATDLTYVVEVSSDPCLGWTTIDPLASINQLSVLDNFPISGVETITIKDIQPSSSAPIRFIRLKVTER